MSTNRSRARAALLLVIVACAWVLFAHGAARAQARGPIYSVDVSGTITAPTVEFLNRALQLAESSNATVLILNVSSRGGVLRDIRLFAAAITESQVPVVVYITPAGTQAGPSGTILLSAAHLSALAPGTSFGSAYPLAQVDAALSQQSRDMVLDSLTSQLRDWNAAHGRNVDWLDRAVRDGAILTNEQAIALNPPAVDLVAADEVQLLQLLEGRSVRLATGTNVTLATLGRTPTAITPTIWEGSKQLLAEPTVAFALLILGALALYLEFAAPGTSIFAGVGILLMLAALIGLFALPVQGWAMMLLLFALVLLGAEFFVPVHGALATIGLVLMIVSGLNLIDPAQAPDTEVALWVILGIALALAVVIALGVLLAMRVRSRPVTTGQEALIGKLAEVRRPLEPEGMVYVDGALWNAISEDGDAPVGERVRVVGMHNLQLIVRRIDEPNAAHSA